MGIFSSTISLRQEAEWVLGQCTLLWISILLCLLDGPWEWAWPEEGMRSHLTHVGRGRRALESMFRWSMRSKFAVSNLQNEKQCLGRRRFWWLFYSQHFLQVITSSHSLNVCIGTREIVKRSSYQICFSREALDPKCKETRIQILNPEFSAPESGWGDQVFHMWLYLSG